MINKQILFIFKIFKDKTKDEILDKLNILINLILIFSTFFLKKLYLI